MAETGKPYGFNLPSEEEFASVVGEEVNALRLEALTVLERTNTDKTSVERLTVQESALGRHGSPHHVLLNLITHLPNHNALSIVSAHEAAIESGLPVEAPLTDEQIIISNSLNEVWFSLSIPVQASSTSAADFANFKSIMSYAMNNIEDGHFIASMYGERGMRTYQEILDFLPVLRTSGALTKGTL